MSDKKIRGKSARAGQMPMGVPDTTAMPSKPDVELPVGDEETRKLFQMLDNLRRHSRILKSVGTGIWQLKEAGEFASVLFLTYTAITYLDQARVVDWQLSTSIIILVGLIVLLLNVLFGQEGK